MHSFFCLHGCRRHRRCCSRRRRRSSSRRRYKDRLIAIAIATDTQLQLGDETRIDRERRNAPSPTNPGYFFFLYDTYSFPAFISLDRTTNLKRRKVDCRLKSLKKNCTHQSGSKMEQLPQTNECSRQCEYTVYCVSVDCYRYY